MFAAYNKLTGTISIELQKAHFDYFDLSYNKLAGRFSHFEIVSSENMSQVHLLEVNRLSGRLPSILNSSYLGEFSALRGNLFGCGNIPEEDEYSEEYSCGSEELDVSLFVFMIVASALCIAAFVIYGSFVLGYVRHKDEGSGWMQNRLLDIVLNRMKYATYLDNSIKGVGDSETVDIAADYVTVERRGAAALNNIGTFCGELSQMTHLFVILICVYLISCIPLYTLKACQYGLDYTTHTTHSYQYRWLLTSAFLRGEVSLWLVVVLWVSVVTSLSMLVVRNSPLRRWLSTSIHPDKSRPTVAESCASNPITSPSGASIEKEEENDSYEITKSKEFSLSDVEATDHSVNDTNPSSSKLKIFLIFTVNTCIVGFVDGLYIHFTSQSLPPSTVVGLQIVMAFFNLIWNMTAVPVLSRPMGTAKRVVVIELGLLILNNIILPCIVTALTSPECFQVYVDDLDV